MLARIIRDKLSSPLQGTFTPIDIDEDGEEVVLYSIHAGLQRKARTLRPEMSLIVNTYTTSRPRLNLLVLFLLVAADKLGCFTCIVFLI